MRRGGESLILISQCVSIFMSLKGAVESNPTRDHKVLVTFAHCAGTSQTADCHAGSRQHLPFA